VRALRATTCAVSVRMASTSPVVLRRAMASSLVGSSTDKTVGDSRSNFSLVSATQVSISNLRTTTNGSSAMPALPPTIKPHQTSLRVVPAKTPTNVQFAINLGIPDCPDCIMTDLCDDPACDSIITPECTDQCHDQCVVVACDDPTHGAPTCDTTHVDGKCSFTCENDSQCDGFDDFVSIGGLSSSGWLIDVLRYDVVHHSTILSTRLRATVIALRHGSRLSMSSSAHAGKPPRPCTAVTATIVMVKITDICIASLRHLRP
jgi:hypothetical protein